MDEQGETCCGALASSLGVITYDSHCAQREAKHTLGGRRAMPYQGFPHNALNTSSHNNLVTLQCTMSVPDGSIPPSCHPQRAARHTQSEPFVKMLPQ